MALILVRVQLMPVHDGRISTSEDEQILIDLRIDEDQRMIAGSHPAFGIFGGLKTSLIYPFVVREDGQFDFGSGLASTIDRYWETNIKARKMRRGELLTIDRDGEIWTYSVAAVCVLAERDLDA